MTQDEKRIYLISSLISENQSYNDLSVPKDKNEQKQLLRALFNVRSSKSADDEFIKIQDEYLQEETRQKGITDYASLSPIAKDIYLWQGDITTLKCDAVVNAANSEMLGCFCPNHGCIDNAIHTFSGIELRLKCYDIMKKQGHYEQTGRAIITPGYNLPCKYIIHTVGPVISGRLTENDMNLLRSCYLSCLRLADENNLHSLAFCCISTGEFHFPNQTAAEIAVQTVKAYKSKTNSNIEVIFNVFKDVDRQIYRKLLEKH